MAVGSADSRGHGSAPSGAPVASSLLTRLSAFSHLAHQSRVEEAGRRSRLIASRCGGWERVQYLGAA